MWRLSETPGLLVQTLLNVVLERPIRSTHEHCTPSREVQDGVLTTDNVVKARALMRRADRPQGDKS